MLISESEVGAIVRGVGAAHGRRIKRRNVSVERVHELGGSASRHAFVVRAPARRSSPGDVVAFGVLDVREDGAWGLWIGGPRDQRARVVFAAMCGGGWKPGAYHDSGKIAARGGRDSRSGADARLAAA
ncbi:MAG: hypothetical protein AAFR38_04145 [Planctomycetota bacterium]